MLRGIADNHFERDPYLLSEGQNWNGKNASYQSLHKLERKKEWHKARNIIKYYLIIFFNNLSQIASPIILDQ